METYEPIVQTDEEVKKEAQEWAESLKDRDPKEIINNGNLGAYSPDYE